jgi:hypothetical protein
MFRTVRLSIVRSLFTVHSATVYVIQPSSRTRMELQFHPGPARQLSTNLYDKSVKLVHLVGFIIKKFVTMHGHMNVKKKACHCLCSMWMMHQFSMVDNALSNSHVHCNTPLSESLRSGYKLKLWLSKLLTAVHELQIPSPQVCATNITCRETTRGDQIFPEFESSTQTRHSSGPCH